jgi:putative DNA methylase
MPETTRYPKRLIEVDLPIRRISEHARREKSLHNGHISSIHIWWARRPLAACRAVLLATLWPDPADPDCPAPFRIAAASAMRKLRDAQGGRSRDFDDGHELRAALLDFIADFADWDRANDPVYVGVARSLTGAATHDANPLVIDPFAGGGAIPVEALRVGCDVFASDLNPIAVLLNRVSVGFIPTYGDRLADELENWGKRIAETCEGRIGRYYPPSEDRSVPTAYIWARTAMCEGPGCGVEVPLIRSLWLAKKGTRGIALRIVPDRATPAVGFEIAQNVEDVRAGTVKGGAVTCPLCGFTTPVTRIRAQLRARHGGSRDARLICLVTSRPGERGKFYRLPTTADLKAIADATECIKNIRDENEGGLPRIPGESPPADGTGSRGGGYRTRKYGIEAFGDFFTPRQLLEHVTFSGAIREAATRLQTEEPDEEFRNAVITMLALAADRQIDRDSAFCRWIAQSEAVGYTFGRQAIPMLWDFVESPALRSSGGWTGSIKDMTDTIRVQGRALRHGGSTQVECASATSHPLPDDSADCVFTDPPYYDAVPYGELSDFFYVWLRRTLAGIRTFVDTGPLTPRASECVVNLAEGKDKQFFERTMTDALKEARRVVKPSGIGVIVFAHKTTAGWEAQLQAMLDAGWIVTASWPIDTERPGRLRALNSAALASSIHLVCRPRENPDGSVRTDEIGDWRDVLQELPRRIHEWMPRLAEEGVVGADAIFACLGPALEIFSRYSRVEKASGETVTLKEYLEQVWAAVSREAISVIFQSADTSGLDPDARLTAVWLWTLGAPATVVGGDESSDGDSEADDEESDTSGPSKTPGFVLEFDAARKIAQGL